MNECVCVRVRVPLSAKIQVSSEEDTPSATPKKRSSLCSGFWLADAKHWPANRIRGSYSDEGKQGEVVTVNFIAFH